MDKDMRKIVEEGYDKGDYPTAFRLNQTPNDMEKYFLDKVLEHCPQKPRILDLGSGIGIPFDKYLVEKGAEVTGIDISQKHVTIAQENVPGARFIKGDFSHLDFKEADFDAIISFYAIFHIPRKEQKTLFLKIYKLLRRKGVFMATLGTSDSEYGEEQNWAGAPMAWSTYNPGTYKKLITKSGFVFLETKFEGQPGGRVSSLGFGSKTLRSRSFKEKLKSTSKGACAA
jgi:SAM-dependent methyltransferase